MPPMARPKLKEQLQRVREDAIIDGVNQLLSEKGYELMTVDEVAATVGIAKASLYTHFRSKEELATAAMVRTLERALDYTRSTPMQAIPAAIDKLRAMVDWTFDVQLAGQMPSLPSQNSSLRAVLSSNKRYLAFVLELSDVLEGWIRLAQKAGDLDRELPAEVVLFTLFARACDAVLPVLKAGGQYTDQQIKQLLIRACFGGLSGSAAKVQARQRAAPRPDPTARGAAGAASVAAPVRSRRAA
jgi:TetR/AcrR family transcriptional regulator of autoinduction and epiphytic fitness